MKILAIPLLVMSSIGVAASLPGKFSGEASAENRLFTSEGSYGNDSLGDLSILFKPEYSLNWDQDRKVISISPYVRISQQDSERSHIDLREFSFVSSWKYLELRIGVSKVFWGVTESQHLVDIINQTDWVENPDGEQKLGQPMINPTLVTNKGNFSLFILPYFRERTFAGEEGRYRGSLLVDAEKTQYIHKDAEKHIDYAIRWSSTWRDMEWAVSYFDGTDREPTFDIDSVTGFLVPVYGQLKQWGLEYQYIYEELLTKAEIVHRDSKYYKGYVASTIGFEYTFSNIAKGKDVGILYEWLYDQRDRNAPTGLNDASFFGSRIAWNDEKSTQLLAGAVVDHETTQLMLFRLEFSRRINSVFSWGLEANVIAEPIKSSLFQQFRSDDYVQLKFSYFL